MTDTRYRIRRKKQRCGAPAEQLALTVRKNEDGSDLPLLSFPAIDGAGTARHFFTTRLGGVSEGKFSSMNLTFSRGDDREHVLENYRRIAAAMGTRPDRFVLTYQVHHTEVIRVTDADAGKGVTRERDWDDVDGLVTNTPGLVLSVFAADCVPILFVDPKRRAIGACHSGWRGTVGRIGGKVIQKMEAEFGSDPGDTFSAASAPRSAATAMRSATTWRSSSSPPSQGRKERSWRTTTTATGSWTSGRPAGSAFGRRGCPMETFTRPMSARAATRSFCSPTGQRGEKSTATSAGSLCCAQGKTGNDRKTGTG